MNIVLSPDICAPNIWRAWAKNNADIEFVPVIVAASDDWLPTILVDIGLFASANQVKKRRPDLWREVVRHETIKDGTLRITIL